MSSEFNIIKNIYELTRLIQLKENYYKRINNVKTRKQFDVIIDKVIIAKTITKTIIIKIVFNIIITTINKKFFQNFFERNFYSSISKSTNFRTSNSNSTRKILIKKINVSIILKLII
jgi:phosphoribosylformylglycinamidine (FGAM) synthase PurS component